MSYENDPQVCRNSLAGVAKNPATLSQPVSQANALLNSLRVAQSETHDAVSTLEARLADVLGPEPAQPDGADVGRLRTSPLCDELDARLGIENSACRRIMAIVARLTV